MRLEQMVPHPADEDAYSGPADFSLEKFSLHCQILKYYNKAT